MGNLFDFQSDLYCAGNREKTVESDKIPPVESLPSSAPSTPKRAANPQETIDFQNNRRSSVELLHVLGESAFKNKSMRFAHLDDLYVRDLLTDEEYAAKMRDLNLSTNTTLLNNTAMQDEEDEEEDTNHSEPYTRYSHAIVKE